jgi:GGDEF domain-containing protein
MQSLGFAERPHSVSSPRVGLSDLEGRGQRDALGVPRSGVIRVTISTSVAALSESGNLEELMRRSNAALYEANEQGRNQVRLAA